MKLLDILSERFPNSKRNTLRKMLTEGRVLVDGEVCHQASKEIDDISTVSIIDRKAATSLNPKPQPKRVKKLRIIFEDEHILVIDKLAGLLSVSTDKMEPDTVHSRALDYVRQTNPKAWAYIVHRLDRETSGVMILAKHKRHKDDLQRQFADREVHRTYLALIEGKPENTHGTIQQFLLEDKFLNIKEVKSGFKGSKEAITHWKVIDEEDGISVVELMIETGRRHQIRFGLASLGCPVVGDSKHGSKINPLDRICLHASALELMHPESGEILRFESPPPFIVS